MDQENPISWKMSTKVLLYWIVTLLSTALIGGLGYLLMPDFSSRLDLPQLLMTGGAIVLGTGVVLGLFAWAVRATRTAHRYGDATFELKNVTVSLGGRLEGQIRANARLAPDQAFNLILQCEATELGGGESGGGSRVKWESEQLLTLADVEQIGDRLLVPVDIAVPGDQPPTGTDRRNQYSWILIFSLEPRSGYSPRFPLTVQRTAESPPEPEKEPEPTIGIVGALQKVGELAEMAKDGRLTAAAATWHQEPPMERPPHARVDVLPRPEGGVEVVLPRTKATLVFSLWLLLSLPLWVILPARGFSDLRAIESAPLIAYLLYCGLGFGVPFLLSGLAASSLAWQTRRVHVGTDGVIVRRRLGNRRHPPGKFTTAAAMGNTTQGWSVHLEKSEGALLGNLQVAALRTGAEARWLAAELRQALGVPPPKSS